MKIKTVCKSLFLFDYFGHRLVAILNGDDAVISKTPALKTLYKNRQKVLKNSVKKELRSI